MEQSYFIHASSYIDDNMEINDNVKIQNKSSAFWREVLRCRLM